MPAALKEVIPSAVKSPFILRLKFTLEKNCEIIVFICLNCELD